MTVQQIYETAMGHLKLFKSHAEYLMNNFSHNNPANCVEIETAISDLENNMEYMAKFELFLKDISSHKRSSSR